ncbi:MAG: ELM1/GtrOC1 family putative glycosyltransferase [Pseudomonadota bacterium]
MTEDGPLDIALVTDGRPGNLVQAQGLAEAIGRQRLVHIAPYETPRDGTFFRPPDIGLATLVIGAGRKGNIVAARLRAPRRKAVAILRPPVPGLRFDAVVTPSHDVYRGAIETVGAMNTLTPDRVARAGEGFTLPPRTLVVMAGGPSRSATFDGQSIARLEQDIAPFRAAGFRIAATASRRTPPDALKMLESCADAGFWRGEGPNPYPGWLDHAAAALVTEDSVNMASEVATVGLPLYISGTGRISAKFQRFHRDLSERGITRPAAKGPQEWSYAPLREADRIATLLLQSGIA